MSRLEFPTVAGIVFGAVGLLMLIGGVVLAFEEPGGLFLCVFGLVFMGAGYMAHRVFHTPPGMRAVAVAGSSVQTGRGTHHSQVFVHVDENATEADVEAARRQWLREAWQRDPGWADGRIVERGVSHGSLHRAAAIAWSVFAAGMVTAAVIWGDMLVFFSVPAVGIAGVLVFQYARQRLRQRRFGSSHFRMQPCPARLGGTLAGVVETGVAHDLAPAGGFELTLRCIHRYETTERVGSNDRRTVTRRNVLWEASSGAVGRSATRGRLVLDVPVVFELPADQPATSLEGGSEGNIWELTLSAELPGLDYAAEFRLPVLADETVDELAMITAVNG